MMTKKRLFNTALFLCFMFECSVGLAQHRVKYNFNPQWKLLLEDLPDAKNIDFDDTGLKEVTLPHAWNEDDAFRLAIDKHPTGVVWYRKHFKLPTADRGKKVFIEFEGVRQAATVYINGKYVGLHENGVMAFGFDITDFLDPTGDNVIAVRTDNDWDYREQATKTKFQWSDRNFNANYGGIPKNVWLHVTGKLHQTLPLYSFLQTSGVYIHAKDFDVPNRSATIVAESEVKNEHDTPQTLQFEVAVVDLDGETVKTFGGGEYTLAPGATQKVAAHARLDGLNFWSWGYGYLYTVVTRLKVNGKTVDELETKTGFRKTDFRDGMVYLNDRVLMMKGYAQRTSNEWPAVGLSVPPWLSDFSNGLMVKGNANLVRWMHITPWKQDVESCDRVGLLQAMPAGDAEHDVEGTRWEQRKQLMRDAIIYNRNNPSIVFYESGNKGITEEHMREMKAIRDQYDPHGGRAIGSREMLDSEEAEYGGEMLYINKSADIPMWATEYSRDESLRKYWDEYSPPYHKDGAGPLYRGEPAPTYNRNQDSHAIENIIRWNEYWRQRPGTGKRVSSGGVNIIFSDSNTHFRGAENYRRSGEVDPVRIEKDGYFAHQVMWNGWVDIEEHGVHIIGHWNYETGVTKPISVVATGEQTELFVNGKSLGFGERSEHFLFTFPHVSWEAGTLKAVTYDAQGKVLAEDTIQTAGRPARIQLTVQHAPEGLKADGADLALVTVEVVDAAGNRCPTALDTIDFDLSGPAEWRGGIAQGPNNYILSKTLPVECGINRVLIRSTAQAGEISLKATSSGLAAGEITFASVPVAVEFGLSRVMPSDGLAPVFYRGPTSAGASFVPSRKAIEIVATEAGSNGAEARLSYDDNERSGWTNDGKLETAWVTYVLATESLVEELDLKMNNFRRRRYPIQVLVDGHEVFRGTTDHSLGYVRLPLKARKGKKVMIRLLPDEVAQQALTIGEEVSGKQLEDGLGSGDAQAKGSLSIIEAEIYEVIDSVPQRFVFGGDRAGYTTVDASTHYSKTHPFGYDFNTTPNGGEPFYFSVAAAEGNYRVTAEVTATGEGAVFTIKSESRRLAFLQDQLAAGETVTKDFIVNIKDRRISGGGTVKLKPREYDKLDWDDKLTIEFNGQHCELRTLTIQPVIDLPTVYLAGNSTVVNQEHEPWASWGQMIPAFFTPDVAVANHAESGLALGSFLGSKRLEKVLSVMQPGDYLFIEFGHNDQKEKGPEAGAWKSYTKRLIHFVEAVRGKGGIPVIVTSTNRRRFDGEGHVENSLGDFPAAARKVAKDYDVPLIDLHRMTAVLYEALGPEQSKKAFVHYPANTYPGQREALKDNTHFNTYGAYQIAQCVLKGIREELPALAGHLRKDAPRYNPAVPDPVASWDWPESPRKDSTKPDGN